VISVAKEAFFKQNRYAEQRHQLSKKQTEVVDALTKTLDSFLDTILVISNKISAFTQVVYISTVLIVHYR